MLSRSECFKILGLQESAGPNAIKRAYRKLAFELHPDLHPDLPDASKRFQQLNEAYVILMQEYANTSFAAGGRRSTGFRGQPGPSGSTGPSGQTGASGSASAEARQAADKAREEARKAYAKASAAFRAGQAGKTGSTGQTGSGGQPGQPGQPEQGVNDAGAASAAGGSRSAGGATRAGRTGRTGNYQPGREEILRDLLNDPFARRVFEDIYSHVRHNSGRGARAEKPPVQPRLKPKAKAKAKPVRRSPLALAGGKVLDLAGGIKGWLRRQIDDEQTMFLPGESLLPGARVRLQVQHGLSGSKRTVEFTLPPEFAPGKPIRLKGLGRKVGSMQGDLYLRVYSAEDSPEALEEE